MINANTCLYTCVNVSIRMIRHMSQHSHKPDDVYDRCRQMIIQMSTLICVHVSIHMSKHSCELMML